MNNCNPSNNVHIMDVGCSNGSAIENCLQKLNKDDAYCIGVDVTKKACNEARKRNLINDVICGDILEIDDKYNSMDFVICMNAISGVSDERKSKIIEKCAKILKSNGRFITNMSVLDSPIFSANKIDELRCHKSRNIRNSFLYHAFVGEGNSAISISQSDAFALAAELKKDAQ